MKKLTEDQQKKQQKDYLLWVSSRGIKSMMGQQIKNARVNKGLTQKALADELGLHQDYISRIEAGKVNISVESLFKICYILDCVISLTEKSTQEHMEHRPRIRNAYIPYEIAHNVR